MYKFVGIKPTATITFDLNLLENKLVDTNETCIKEIKQTWFDSFIFRKSKYLQKGLQLIDKLKVLQSSLCPELVS